jgi:hypothetical protein
MSFNDLVNLFQSTAMRKGQLYTIADSTFREACECSAVVRHWDMRNCAEFFAHILGCEFRLTFEGLEIWRPE